jgi:metal-sulfur cluster biosynthetic enzyme
MVKNMLEEDVRNVVVEIKHPAIDRTLLDLGIVKDIAIEESTVTVTFAFPFPTIPAQIREYMVNTVVEPIKKLGAEVKTELTVMNPEELQAFLAMEQESWKGL